MGVESVVLNQFLDPILLLSYADDEEPNVIPLANHLGQGPDRRGMIFLWSQARYLDDDEMVGIQAKLRTDGFPLPSRVEEWCGSDSVVNEHDSIARKTLIGDQRIRDGSTDPDDSVPSP